MKLDGSRRLAKRVRDAGQRIQRRIGRGRRDEAGSGPTQAAVRIDPSEATRASTHPSRTAPVEAYVNSYVERVVDHVRRGQSCLLLGVLGTGKSEVLQLSKAKIEGGHARVVLIDVASDPQLSPRTLWQQVLGGIGADDASNAIDTAIDPGAAARAAVRDWMRRERRTLVVMLDQTEMLEQSAPIFAELRAMFEQQDADAGRDDDRGGFVIVLASTEALRRDITSPNSPLHNIVKLVYMDDCPPDIRAPFWRGVLTGAGVTEDIQPELLANLDELCAGDPYVMRNVAQKLADDVGDSPSAADPAATARRALYATASNPVQVAPLFRRYAELVEADADAVVLIKTLHEHGQSDQHVTPDQQQTSSACVWRGVFAHDGTVWRFRNGLIRRFFWREFGRKPDRVARALSRHGRHELAIRHLWTSRNKSADVVRSLREVMVNWVQMAYSPSQAWDLAAQAMHTWFGDEAAVLRYDARQETSAGPPPYMRVQPNSLDVRADAILAEKVHRAFQARRDTSQQGKVVLKPITIPPDSSDPGGGPIFIFPFVQHGLEYGALVLSSFAHDEAFTGPRSADDLDVWTDLLNAVFGEIAGFERQLLANVNLSMVQHLAQKHRAPEETDWVLWMMLTALTAGFGLKFNRCALLQADGGNRLRGRRAIGHFRAADWERALRETTSITFDGWLQGHTPGKIPGDASTPLQAEIDTLDIRNWRDDPVLGQLAGPTDYVALHRSALAGSPLAQILRVDDEPGEGDGPATDPGFDGEGERGFGDGRNAVLLVPLRDGDQLAGVLALDKPFSDPDVTQEQLDQVLSFAGQVLLTLRNDLQQRQSALFDELNAIPLKPLSLQQTLEDVCRVLFKHMPGRMSQLVITSWEANDQPDRGPNRRQSIVRVAHSAEHGDLLGGHWQHFYYAGNEACRGPIDEALRSPSHILVVDDLPAWLHKHPSFRGPGFVDGVRSLVSIGLDSGADSDIPRGVISFQSAEVRAYHRDDIRLLMRLASRVANITEKARVFEGLSRARAHTDQLDLALKGLMQQKTRRELYGFIVSQVSALFTAGAGGISSDQATWPDSAALFQLANGKLGTRLAGQQPEFAEALTGACERILAVAGKSQHPVFVEYASKELLARESFGDDECLRHAAVGAEASAWARIGDDLLLVLCWKEPRRMNQRERSTLPVLATVAARTNGVIEAEREQMREQLSTSLRVEDYDLIEAEQTHQWHRRIRNLKNSAMWALEAMRDKPIDQAFAYATERLQRILTLAREGEERLAYGSIKQVERIALAPWVRDRVAEWNMLHRLDGVQCIVLSELADDATIETRPVILRWVLHELLNNANEAELAALSKGPVTLNVHMPAGAAEAELSMHNPTPIPADVLTAIASRNPVDRREKRGRGIWIVGQQVTNLLNGKFSVPQPGDRHTRFTITLPALVDGLG